MLSLLLGPGRVGVFGACLVATGGKPAAPPFSPKSASRRPIYLQRIPRTLFLNPSLVHHQLPKLPIATASLHARSPLLYPASRHQQGLLPPFPTTINSSSLSTKIVDKMTEPVGDFGLIGLAVRCSSRLHDNETTRECRGRPAVCD